MATRNRDTKSPGISCEPRDRGKKFPDGAVRFDRVSQGQLELDLVSVPAALSDATENSGCLQIENDLLHRPLGDADSIGHIAEPGGRVLEQTDQNVRVVGEERPALNLAASGTALGPADSVFKGRTRCTFGVNGFGWHGADST